MTIAREHQIHTESTPYYHCISRCVRRAFLCGKDQYSGQCYEHRRQWIIDKIKLLSSLFAIDICAYAVMSNHYHLVLHVDNNKISSWSMDEVINRWCELFGGNLLVKRYKQGEPLSTVERNAVLDIVEIWRSRLGDISWFMRCLNESIARQANLEDHCKGRFWDGRFKSQALLDETALLTCMVYVDLNPIRAGICKTPELSEYTSIRERLLAYKYAQDKTTDTQSAKMKNEGTLSALLPFVGSQSQHNISIPGIAFETQDYFELVDWTGRQIRNDKPGSIPAHISSILDRLQANEDEWVNMVNHFGQRFHRVVGPADLLRKITRRFNRNWFKGLFQCERLYQVKLNSVK